MDHHINGIALPNEAGFFGNYGGQFRWCIKKYAKKKQVEF